MLTSTSMKARYVDHDVPSPIERFSRRHVLCAVWNVTILQGMFPTVEGAVWGAHAVASIFQPACIPVHLIRRDPLVFCFRVWVSVSKLVLAIARGKDPQVRTRFPSACSGNPCRWNVMARQRSRLSNGMRLGISIVEWRATRDDGLLPIQR